MLVNTVRKLRDITDVGKIEQERVLHAASPESATLECGHTRSSRTVKRKKDRFIARNKFHMVD